MSINRRDFLKASIAAGAGATGRASGAETQPGRATQTPGNQAILDRMGFGAWINDVRTEPLPFDSWPPVLLDDIAEKSIIATMDLQARSGYNMFDLFGLFAAYGWPVDIVSAVDKERIGRLKECILHALDDVTTVAYARETARTR